MREFCSKSMARAALGFRASGGTANTPSSEPILMVCSFPYPGEESYHIVGRDFSALLRFVRSASGVLARRSPLGILSACNKQSMIDQPQTGVLVNRLGKQSVLVLASVLLIAVSATIVAQNQAAALLAAELVLKGQKNARILSPA